MAGSGRTSVDVGLLILRLGIGAIFIGHGLPKLLAGPEKWSQLGAAVGLFGITWAPPFWGFIAACSECVGGLFLIIGFLVRPFAFLMLITMLVAVNRHLHNHDAYAIWSYAAAMAVVFLSLVVTGAGSLDILSLLKALKEK